MSSEGPAGRRVRPFRLLVAAALLGGAPVAIGCTLLPSLDEVQCSRSEDCVARGASFANAICAGNVCVPGEAGEPWECLDEAPPPSDPSLSVDVEFIAFDTFKTYTLGSALDGGTAFTLIDYTPLPGTTIYGCYVRDPACLTPATPHVVTDDSGVAHVKVRGDAVLVYHIDRPGSFPGLYYPGRLLAGEPHVTYPVSSDSYQSSAALEAFLGTVANHDPDAGLGQLIVSVYDCKDRPLGGVSVKLDGVDAGTPFYVADHLPSRTATRTDPIEGTAGFINVPQGIVEIRSTRADRSFVTSVSVRSGSATFVDVRPRVRSSGAASTDP